jgi:hypothetical protein
LTYKGGKDIVVKQLMLEFDQNGTG